MSKGALRKIVALLVTAALALAIPAGGALLALAACALLHLPIKPGANVAWLYVQHAGQLVVALALIALFKRTIMPADYGLHAPRGRSYVPAALLWGAIFGVVMTLIDYAPQLIAGARPAPGDIPTPGNVAAGLLFQGVWVGPTEEIPFRALLVTYLAAAMPGQVRLGRFRMEWAGVIVALLFALLHAGGFFSHDWPEALGQQVYAFILGVLYAYWLEKSRSVLAPAIGHNASDVTEYLIVLLWAGGLHF